MQVSATSREELFTEAVRGLMDLLKPEGIQPQQARTDLHVAAPDSTSLLVDFLSEVLTCCHIRREVYTRVAFPSMSAVTLDAELEGHPVVRFGEDVKAVTYHEADVQERNGLWSTTLVFDV
jgi:SHS2 domain-containing protein